MGKKSNSKGTGGDFYRAATTRDMTKIVTYLEGTNYSLITYIVKATGLLNSKVRDGLLFLMKYGIVFWFKKDCLKFYMLNPRFKDMKEKDGIK